MSISFKMSSSYTLIGYFAAFCTTAAFLPQVTHTIKTNDTTSISIGMYILFVSGVGLWLVYGLLKHDMPIIVANGITFLLASVILAFKAWHLFDRK